MKKKIGTWAEKILPALPHRPFSPRFAAGPGPVFRSKFFDLFRMNGDFFRDL